MKRRAMLQGVLAGLAGPPEWLDALGRAAVTPSAALKSAHPSPESYRAPDWLRYCRLIYFEGYAPPVFPHLRDFDASHIVELALELGGDTLRFQPIGYQAVYPSRVFPVHPELGNRDLIDEVSRECRRRGLRADASCPSDLEGQAATFTMEGPYAVVLLPTLHIAEVVHVRLAPIATAKLVNR